MSKIIVFLGICFLKPFPKNLSREVGVLHVNWLARLFGGGIAIGYGRHTCRLHANSLGDRIARVLCPAEGNDGTHQVQHREEGRQR